VCRGGGDHFNFLPSNWQLSPPTEHAKRQPVYTAAWARFMAETWPLDATGAEAGLQRRADHAPDCGEVATGFLRSKLVSS